MKKFRKPYSLILIISTFFILSCDSNLSFKGKWIIKSIDIHNNSESGMAGMIWANMLSQNTPLEFKDKVVTINNTQNISYVISDGKMIFDSGDTLSYSINGSTMKLSKKDVDLNLVRE
jgi:hypothetical protein